MKLSDGMCKICQNNQEDFEHLLILCTGLNLVWDASTCLIRLILPNFILTKDIQLFGIHSQDEISNTIINTIVCITRWQIWKRRCMKKFSNKNIPIQNCISQIKSTILEHLQILEKKDKFVDKIILLKTGL